MSHRDMNGTKYKLLSKSDRTEYWKHSNCKVKLKSLNLFEDSAKKGIIKKRNIFSITGLYWNHRCLKQ